VAFRRVYTEQFLSLPELLGRSVVVHGPENSAQRIACGTIELVSDRRVSGRVGGVAVELRQASPFDTTNVNVDTTSALGAQLQLAIHDLPVPDSVAGEDVCDLAGPVFAPWPAVGNASIGLDRRFPVSDSSVSGGLPYPCFLGVQGIDVRYFSTGRRGKWKGKRGGGNGVALGEG
jgi:hypothetical protein